MYSFQERTTDRPCVGIEISDTLLRFVELEPLDDQLAPVRYGTVAVAFDTLSEGTIKNRPALINSLKQLREQTSAPTIYFSHGQNADIDELWSEIFLVSGFAEAQGVASKEAIPQLLSGATDSVITGTVINNQLTVTIYDQSRMSAQSHSFLYPIGSSTAESIRTLMQRHDNARIALVGDNQQNVHDIVFNLDTNGIDAYVPNVWRNVLDLDSYVPKLERADSLLFVGALALAYVGAHCNRTEVSEDHFVSTRVYKKPVPMTLAESFKDVPAMSREDNETTPQVSRSKAQLVANKITENHLVDEPVEKAPLVTEQPPVVVSEPKIEMTAAPKRAEKEKKHNKANPNKQNKKEKSKKKNRSEVTKKTTKEKQNTKQPSMWLSDADTLIASIWKKN